jgi:hypothetical protein
VRKLTRGSNDNGHRRRGVRKIVFQPYCISLTGHSLNLAVANRVFLVEPQWNPSVENQAIARALRLGQEQTVKVIRYVVDGTVEQVSHVRNDFLILGLKSLQEMRQLQRKKLKLAGIAWE